MSDVRSVFTFADLGWPSAVGPSEVVLPLVGAAATDAGSAVRDLFATDLNALAALRSAARSEVSWISGTDVKTGLSTQYVAVGDTFLTAGVTPRDTATKVLEAGASDPRPIGFFYLTLTTGGSGSSSVVTQLMSATATYQGSPLTVFSTEDGLKDLIGGLVDKAVSFVQNVFELAWEAPAANGLEAAADAFGQIVQDAAEAGSGPTTITGPGGSVIQTDVTMTTGEAVSMGIGLAAVLALFSLELLAKQMTAYVRVYNTTDAEVDVSLAWLHSGAGYSGPRANEFVTLARVGPVWTPPWVIGQSAVSYTQWVCGNTDSLSRIAYVLRVVGPGIPATNVMVDIPNAGQNSLAVGIGEDEDFAGFWKARRGADTGLVAGAEQDGLLVRIATNQNSGRSSSPADGSYGYSFEHVVLIGTASAD